MKLLYCPVCMSYLEGGDGTMQDCHCGWKQFEEEEEEDKDIEEEEEEE